MKKIYLCENENNIRDIYSKEVMEKLNCYNGVFSYNAVKNSPELFADTEYIFSTWGMPAFSEEEIRKIFPNLKCVFYAAGSVQSFATPFLRCGVRVFSAWAANAVPVAEYTVSQILLANKGFFPLCLKQSRGDLDGANKIRASFCGNYDAKVGLIGIGMIGGKVAEMLRAFKLQVLAYDPFLSDQRAEELGIRLVSLEELFEECQVISNHLANNEQTRGLLNYCLFSKMRTNAVFINTGRGAQVVEDDLARVLKERPDLYALLDVTDPEPPIKNHNFYKLENCLLTPHIAGSLGNEVHRMAEYMADEYNRYVSNLPCKYEVFEKMLKTMA